MIADFFAYADKIQRRDIVFTRTRLLENYPLRRMAEEWKIYRYHDLNFKKLLYLARKVQTYYKESNTCAIYSTR